MKIILPALLLAVASPVLAQAPGAREHAVLEGVVVDSLRGGFLRNAPVAVVGPSRMAFTDSAGRFRIDSIPPGEYQVALFDPLLDTLALEVLSPKTRFAAGETVTLVMAVPSALTIARTKCGAQQTSDGQWVLLGQVLYADDLTPVEGARLSMGWMEYSVEQGQGLKQSPRQRAATSGPGGFYRICGLPRDLRADAQVEKGEEKTGAVVVASDESPLTVMTFLLPGVPVAASGDSTLRVRAMTSGSATIRGQVSEHDGSPVQNAHVSLDGGGATITDSTGRFVLEGQPGGTRTLIVRRLGYVPAEATVNATPVRVSTVNLRLARHVPILEEVVIAARREAVLSEVGFIDRRRAGRGRYLDSDDVELRSPGKMSYALNGIGGLRLEAGNLVGRLDGRGNRCVRIFIDGRQFRTLDKYTIDDVLTPTEVGAVEVYSAHFTPPEFQDYDACETVLIWTKWKLRL